MKVYKAINAVQADLSREGITKDRRNQSQGYNFRGIDDVFNALSPMLARHGLCILPRILSRECVERTSQKGGVLFYVTVEAEFDFVSAEDGSKHTVRTYGEAMDSADKATNKAMSAAYKYAALQAFAIPTEADNDADAHNFDVKPTAQPVASKAESWIAKIAAAADLAGMNKIRDESAADYGDIKNVPPAVRSAFSARKAAIVAASTTTEGEPA